MARAFSEIAFTPSVISIQEMHGSAESYSKFLEPEADRADRIGPAEAEFISSMDGFYQATVSETGWPYVQFRGGPRGFLKVIDDKTIAYADFRGNRQYISTGNLGGNERISMILMDYPNRRRLKVYGRARLVPAKDDADLMAQLKLEGYRALPERAVVISIEGLDWNCPQHIPQRLTLEELQPHLHAYGAEIARLKQENEELRERANDKSDS